MGEGTGVEGGGGVLGPGSDDCSQGRNSVDKMGNSIGKGYIHELCSSNSKSEYWHIYIIANVYVCRVYIIK